MAAGRLLIPPWMPALDSDGAPIPNARVYFYVDETTTLAAVFSDEALTTPLTNPVEANSSGRFPAIWASDANVYTWSIDAPYGPAGIPFTGTGLQVSQDSAILVLAGTEAAADEALISSGLAVDAYNDILALAAAAPDTDPIVIAAKANVTGSNILGANQAAFANNLTVLQNGTGAVTRTIPDKLRDLVSIKDFGAVGIGVTDDTTKVQAWATAGGGYVPAGTYYVSGRINLPSGFRAVVALGARFLRAPLSVPGGERAAVFFAFQKTDIAIIGEGDWFVESAADQAMMWAAMFISCREVTVTNLNAVRMNQFMAESASAASTNGILQSALIPYASVVIDPDSGSFNGSAQIECIGGSAVFNAAQAFGPASRCFSFCNGFYSSGGFFKNGPAGIQAWGGNSNPASDGALANERKCKNGYIEGSRSVNCHAWVWTAMTDGVEIANHSGDTSTDVGFDAEGSFNTKFTNCSGVNAVNGTLSTFFYNRDVVFDGCYAQNIAANPTGKIFNVTGLQDNQSVSFLNTVFVSTGGIGRFTDEGGCVRDLVVSGCTFKNTRIDLAASNKRNVTLRSVYQSYSVASGVAFSSIKIAGMAILGANSPVVVMDNVRVTSDVAQPASSYAYDVQTNDANTILSVSMRECSVLPNRSVGAPGFNFVAFPTDFRAVATDPNAGFPSMWDVQDCNFNTISLTKGTAPSRFLVRGILNAIMEPATFTFNSGAVLWREGSKTYDPPSIASGASTNTTVSVPGAVAGERCTVGFTSALSGCIITGQAITDNVVVTISNLTGGAVDPVSGTVSASV